MAIEYERNIITSGYNLNKINDNFGKIEDALVDGLSRSGQGPNQMEADIDLNSNDLLNVKTLDVQNISYQGDTLAPEELVLTGSMLKSQYDPNNHGTDVYNRANHTGTTPTASLDIPSVATAITPSVGAILYELTDFFADGVTDDSANFTTLELTTTNKLIDMRGKSFRVGNIPSGNMYVNGFWIGPFENWEDTNDLTQVQWTKVATTISGTNVVIPSTANTTHYVEAPSIPVSSSFPLYISTKGKNTGYNILRIRLSNAITGTFISEAIFNHSTGAISGDAQSITTADGSGYRVGISKFTIPSGMTSAVVRFYVYDNAGNDIYAGDGVSGFDIQDMKWGYNPIPAIQDRGLISSSVDTGGVGLAYAGGVYGNVAIPGRSTNDLFAVIASQSSRAKGPSRAAVLASIYSAAMGNVSSIIASRHSQVWVPQSVIIGSEECGMYSGFRGVIVASISCRTENESNFIASSRNSYASGRNSSVISASGGYAGRGGGWRGIAVANGGAITSITTARDLYGVLEVGRGYQVGDPIFVYDRLSGSSDCVAQVASVDANGGILTVSISVGGTGYGTVPAPNGEVILHPTVDNGTGDFAVNIATSGYTETQGTGSAIIASSGQSTNWTTVSGGNAAIVASQISQTAANTSAIIASAGCSINSSGVLSAVICGNNSQVTAAEAVVFGRRVINPTTRELAGGDFGSGSPLSSNRKWSISNASGIFKSITTFSASGTFADFGEYFENKEFGFIPYGTIVMLEGDKIIPWDGVGTILGVVSATVAFIANDADFQWQGRFLKGEFGEIILDENGEPIENPDYDPTLELIARSQRPEEWSPVGLLGQVYVKVDADKVIGSYIGDKLKVMAMTTPYDAVKGYGVARCFLR